MSQYNRITSRSQFVDYCLRRLGHPVIEINVDDEQIEDRVNDALQLFGEYNGEGSYRIYVTITITAAMVTRGSIDFDLDTGILPSGINPDDILSILRVLPFDTSSSSTSFMDAKYQMRLNDIHGMQNGVSDIAGYEQMQQYLSLIDMKLTGTPQIQWTRQGNSLQIFGDLGGTGDLKAGKSIVAEMYVATSANANGKLYNNIFLKEYATALIKEQWGANLIKFEGMVLPGGVQLNGRQIYEDAKSEIEVIRQRIYNEYDTPPDFFVG